MASPSVVAADAAAIARAADLLRSGRLVAFPTETVYGLGGDAHDDRAVASVYAAKGRPRFNPLIVHGATIAAIEPLVRFNASADRLAAAFWPGPLTLVLPRAAACPVSLLASAGLETLAVRVPAHPVAAALLESFGGPIVGPSANPSGRVSPTTAEHVAQSFNTDALALVLDGGPCRIGVESTVVDLSGDTPALLRPGGITSESIAALVGTLGLAETEIDDDGPRRSPGTSRSHYAPSLAVRLNAQTVDGDEALLAFGRDVPRGAAVTLNLSPGGDTTEAAAILFAMLRALDRRGVARIAVMPIPEAGLGLAINDRLRRAAAPRN